MSPISNFKSTNTDTNNLKRYAPNTECGGVGDFASTNKRKQNKEKSLQSKYIHKTLCEALCQDRRINSKEEG